MTSPAPGLPPSRGSRPRNSGSCALVLAGGGMRVAYQAGVLRALEEAGLEFALMDGASGGTMNLAMRLSGLSVIEMCDRWRTLEVQDFASLLTLKEYFNPGGWSGFGDADGIGERVFPHLGIDVERIRAAVGLQASFNVCNFTDKVNVPVRHQDITLDLLVAGVSLPMFMPAVSYNGKTYVDAVWIKDANLTDVVKAGAEEIWVVWCIGNTPDYNPGTLEQYVHMIEICANAALFAELAWINELNQELRAGKPTAYGQTQPIVVHIIKPEYALPLDPEYFLGRINADTLISMGYTDACRYLATSPAGGSELSPAATKMRAVRGGVTFKESFSGKLDVADPSLGLTPGAARFRMVVRIVDLAAFMQDPGAGAQLVGSADLPGMGDHLPFAQGRFAISVEPDGARLVTFDACVQAGEHRLRIQGHKTLRDDRGPDMLDDLSSLALTLHVTDAPRGDPAENTSQQAATVKRVAHGKLLLDGGLIDVAESIASLGAQGLKERSEAVSRFVQFYGKQLFAVYLRPNKPWWKFW